MPNNVYTAAQGEAWDQAALARLGSEKQMSALLPDNVDEMDALLFGGGTPRIIPDVKPQTFRSLPPWERM